MRWSKGGNNEETVFAIVIDLGFAITSNLAHRLLIAKKGFWTGIDGLLLSGEWVRIFNIPQPAGMLVQRVADKSPVSAIGLIGGTYKAAIAGGELLVGGDIILGVGGIAVTADGAGLMSLGLCEWSEVWRCDHSEGVSRG